MMKKPLLMMTCLLALAAQAKPMADTWVGTWAAAAEYTGVADMPQTTNLSDCSLRQVVHVSLGGETLRLRLSNEMSAEPVEIKSVYIADAAEGEAIDATTARYLSFQGKRMVTIAAGQAVTSDALKYSLKPLQRLSITISYGRVPQNATSHRGSRTTSYIMPGVSVPKAPFTTSEQVAHWYNIAAIDVISKGEAVAVLGNSITDGRGSTTDAQDRWTDRLAEALNGEMGVLNLGIGGNCVVRGGLSEPAVKRFDRDILAQAGVSRIIIFEGINDVGNSTQGELTAADLIAAYRQFIRKGHAHGKQVYGATLSPMGRSFYWSSFREATRQTVNEWIRTSGEFDGIIDFDALVRDPLVPSQLSAAWQTDWLHLNPQGYQAMGDYAAQWLRNQMQAEQSRALVGTGNPYLPLWEHVPDGEPRVFEDPDNAGKYRVYVIGSHDTRMTSYCGADIRMWSAPVEDLTNWRDEGPLFTYEAQQKWDVMYAPDLVEVNRPDGTRQYYLYPHSRGWQREAMVCRSDRPDGPFTPVNLSADGLRTTEGSMLGFDPSVFIEPVSDTSDPDHATGFRAYGFWGFQRSSAAQLDPNTMCTPRPGTEVIPFFLPACTPDGSVRDPHGTTYPALYSDQKPSDFAFFEASSIRQIGNKYVMIYSGYSGKEYGLPSSNSTLRYAYADTPLGPWRSGGVLVDSRGVVPNEDGSRLITTNAGHNTHGSMQLINGQWYVFYHRPPRGFGFARQSMVAPVSVQSDEKPVSEGGRVVITAYDPYAPNHLWQAAAADGHVYRGAEVTSEGFQLFGMPPYRYYSAGYACYLSQGAVQQDSYDVWDNHMDVDMTGDAIVGFKYFGFGGLQQSQLGLPAFEGTARGNQTQLDIFLEPTTAETFTLSVWMDAPWDNQFWHGRKLGDITIPAGSAGRLSRYTLDVASVVDRLDGKHALYLVASHGASCRLQGLGFSRKGAPLTAPQAPVVTITVDGVPVALPAIPEPSTEDNGYTDCTHYRATCRATSQRPVVAATASNPAVRIDIVQQPASATDCAIIKCSFLGKSKTYTLQFVKE